MFLKRGLPMALSQSYAKNMGMYGQRIGALSIVCDNAKEAACVESQLKAVARAKYSNPPVHGALLVHEILSSPDLKKMWCAPLQSFISPKERDKERESRAGKKV
jgi:aspartate aminotransferase, mitochondrial